VNYGGIAIPIHPITAVAMSNTVGRNLLQQFETRLKNPHPQRSRQSLRNKIDKGFQLGQ
jgi:hypothetical protein